jgi:hypothetical protein
MNGALGTVLGFVWPQGGDPHSPKRQLQSPVCVVVEFDDIDLGEEQALDEHGDPVVQAGQFVFRRKNFFPSLVESLGCDERGVPRADRCVPIFHSQNGAESDDKVSRSQFPLVLAWALTHWKAQGMTLRRTRVRMGLHGLAAWHRVRGNYAHQAPDACRLRDRSACMGAFPGGTVEAKLPCAASLRMALGSQGFAHAAQVWFL